MAKVINLFDDKKWAKIGKVLGEYGAKDDYTLNN